MTDNVRTDQAVAHLTRLLDDPGAHLYADTHVNCHVVPLFDTDVAHLRALLAEYDQLTGKLDHDEVRRLRSLMAELAFERGRQLAKWGDQRHPDGTSLKNDDWRDHVSGQCQRAAAEGRVTWAHILQEEFVEALAEVDPVKIRAELLQVAAVCAAWIGDIDRRHPASPEVHADDPGAELHIDVSIEDGDQVSTWRCPVCKNTVSVRSELLDWARQQIARYAPHTDCQPPEPPPTDSVHDDQADEAEACLADYERGDDDPDLHP